MKNFYFKFLILVIICLAINVSQSQNILYDGDFSQSTEIIPFDTPTPPLNAWAYWINYGEGALANPMVINEECYFQITNPGFNTWDIQLVQWGFPLIQGHSYQLTFEVKADVERSFGVFLGEDGGSYTNLIGYDQYLYYATSEWQTISIEFEAFNIFPLHKLSFELGTNDTTTYFDNITLVDLGGVQEDSIGILGTAVNGWDVDVDMETTDGVNYFLYNYPLIVGELKFRQDNNWIINWGGTAFPIGTAWLNGPNIPILYAANYDITFNKLTGDYSFICLTCPANIGMLGSALNGWLEDIDMTTTDGITYTLNDFYFTSGEAKFRQDNSWDINWGGDTFPNGVALLNGPNIPVQEGTYNVTFNIETGEYSFEWPPIGIIGSALNGWSDDIDMESEDGIIYTLDEYYFTSGEAKFRTNDSWIINWGGDTFPDGFAVLYGPNIPVIEGTYNVTFNRLSGEYNFVATCSNLELQCPSDIYTENLSGLCGDYVEYPEVVPSVNCSDAIWIEQTSGLPSGSLFPVGTTTNTFVLTNSTGDTATCSFNVTVIDSEPPEISDLNEIYAPLWPANHKMIPVFIEYITTDNCDIVNTELYISSNEPENGLGDGDKTPDWEIIDEHNVLLRAERSGNGNGREYYITITAFDESWNYTERQITIFVPHDNSKISKELNNSEPVNYKYTLYPNGTDAIINLKGPKSLNKSQYAIYDMFGVMRRNGIIENEQINVKTLPKGIYILGFETDDGYFYRRFLKY